MPETPERLHERLVSEGLKTVEFFQALSLEQWDRPVYSDGSCWKISQILAHFVSTEKAFGLLIADVLSGGDGAPEGFDIDRFNEAEVGRFMVLDRMTLLEQYGDLRRHNAGLISGMKPADLSRVGRHPFMGITTLEEIIKLLYRHNQIHQRDVRRLLLSQMGELSG